MFSGGETSGLQAGQSSSRTLETSGLQAGQSSSRTLETSGLQQVGPAAGLFYHEAVLLEQMQDVV